MVSDFIDEVAGYLRDGNNQARLMLEIQKDGYFNNNLLLPQVEKAVDIFEKIHPNTNGIFLFDNAPSHHKVASDALNVQKMNVRPGGKQPLMRDTVWEGSVQTLVGENGVAKGMKAILQERGVNTKGMKAKDTRELGRHILILPHRRRYLRTTLNNEDISACSILSSTVS